MPTYNYRCVRGHEIEKFEPMSAPTTQACPQCLQDLPKQCTCQDACTCARPAMVRQIGPGAGFTFKGGSPTPRFSRRR